MFLTTEVIIAVILIAITMVFFLTRKRKINNDNEEEQNLNIQENQNDDIDKEEDEEDIIEEAETLSPQQSQLISRVKLAKQKALNKKIEASLTEGEKKMEKIMESQQIAKIFSLLRDNSDAMGNMSIEDVKNQMHMYYKFSNDENNEENIIESS